MSRRFYFPLILAGAIPAGALAHDAATASLHVGVFVLPPHGAARPVSPPPSQMPPPPGGSFRAPAYDPAALDRLRHP